MWYRIEQQITRTVIVLCGLIAHDVRSDVVQDMRDEVAMLIHLWVRAHTVGAGHQDPLVQLRRWCMRLHERLQVLAVDAGSPADHVLATHQAVLRLRVALDDEIPGSPTKKSPTSSPLRTSAPRVSGVNQKKILEFIRERSVARTKEVTDHFAASLSDRTVKRCLKDLVSVGSIVRIKNDRAVSYRLVS